MHDKILRPTDRMLRQFAGLWIVFFAALAAWHGLYHERTIAGIILSALAVTVGPIGLVWPRAIRPIFVGWMALTYPVGWLVSRIVLGALFYGIFTPVAFVFRLMRRDELGLRRQIDATTYWETKHGATDKKQYLRQF
ncbi:MAG: SxtJ family membrane protein [Vicinamibacterales bacterium]